MELGESQPRGRDTAGDGLFSCCWGEKNQGITGAPQEHSHHKDVDLEHQEPSLQIPGCTCSDPGSWLRVSILRGDVGTGGKRSGAALLEPQESGSGAAADSSWWKPHSPTFLMQREQVITERFMEPEAALRGHGRAWDPQGIITESSRNPQGILKESS